VAPFPTLSDLPKKAVFLDIRLFAPPGFAVDPFETESTNPTARVLRSYRSGYVRNLVHTACS
jgi:hypothetical protein